MSDKVMVDKAELERLQAAARDAVTRWHIDRKWAMARGQDEYPEAEWVTELREAAALAPAGSERAAAGEDWRTVHAVVEEANHMPNGFVGMSDAEDRARSELVEWGRVYRNALRDATQLPYFRDEYHAALTRFRTFCPAPAVAE